MVQVIKRGPGTPEMNLTPLIDVVFQLIIFFMLVSNIIAEESVQMIVPKLDNARTERIGEIERVTVNVLPRGYNVQDRTGEGFNPLVFSGEPLGVKIGMTSYAMDDLASMVERLEVVKNRSPKVEVVLRADAALYYGAVQQVMAAITEAGISKVHLVAYLPEES